MKIYDLMTKMENIVHRNVKHFRTDFYEYDRPVFFKAELNGTAAEWLWITRDCGTWLFECENGNPINMEFYRSVCEEWPKHHMHRITFSGTDWTIKACRKAI